MAEYDLPSGRITHHSITLCRDSLVEEVRRKQRDEIFVQGERVRLEYKKGRKSYFEECPGGVARTIDSRLLCGNYRLSAWVPGPSFGVWCPMSFVCK